MLIWLAGSTATAALYHQFRRREATDVYLMVTEALAAVSLSRRQVSAITQESARLPSRNWRLGIRLLHQNKGRVANLRGPWGQEVPIGHPERIVAEARCVVTRKKRQRL